MKCINCGAFSLSLFCGECERILRETTPQKREISGLNVYSFYPYSEISSLILSKHEMYGAFVYKRLAKFSFTPFIKAQNFGTKINAIGIDTLKNDYSHTAILVNALKTKEVIPLHNALKINSKFKYSGQNLAFRLKHKRNFSLEKMPKFPVILVDDVITTGTTLLEAKEICEKNGVRVLFGLTLANAKE